MAQQEIDPQSGVETTGHSWDGIKELNNPLPRWWLITFWISVVWAIGYWVLMPAWPGLTGYTKGVRNHSERANVAKAMETVVATRDAQMSGLLSATSMEAIERDEKLFQYVYAAGASLFGDNCATCHGAGGQGFPGYPNLNDESWVWGGTLADINRTIRYGIRSGHPETRQNLMQAYGRNGLLPTAAIDDLVEHVSSLSGKSADAAAATRGAAIFAQQCASCHGENGGGDMAQGAPNLRDAIWLYGGDKQTIRDTIYNGRAGVMPAWQGRLKEEQITALAVYVHSRGGGQ
jgi:cytochrome c oxidase cbb3-type subunit 3